MKRIVLFIFCSIPLLLFAQQPQFRSYTTKDGLTNNYVNQIVQDKTGYLWIATRMGLNRFNGSEFKTYFNNKADSTSLPYNSILSLFVDSQNRLWIGSYASKVVCLDISTDKFTTFEYEKHVNPLHVDVFSFFENDKGEISISTGFGFYKLRGKTFVMYSNTAPILASNAIKNQNSLWECTSSGIKHSKQGVTKWFTTENTAEILSNSFQSVFKDKDNNLWFSTHGGGVVSISFKREQLQQYSSKNISIANNIVFNFHKDNQGNLWVATDGGGLSVYNSQMQRIKQINAPGYPQNNSVLDFCENKNLLWACGWETGVFSINTKTFEVKSYKEVFSKFRISNRVKAIEIANDTVYCATYGNGVVLINSLTGAVYSNTNTKRLVALNRQLYINDICVDVNKNMWVASIRGLLKYDNNSMKPFELSASPKFRNDRNVIMGVQQGNKNELLVSTAAGPYIINTKTNTVEFINIGAESFQEIKFFYKDSRNRYWIGNNDNLYLLRNNTSIASIKLTQYERSLDFINTRAVYQDAKGYLFIGSQDGFFTFHPDSIDIEIKAPTIILESLQIKNVNIGAGDNSILDTHINEAKEIALDYDDFPFSISFSSINFNAKTAVTYSYKVVGLDTSWVTVSGKNELLFHNLAPGSYTLQIRNTNIYGKWSEEIKEKQIIVLPPFWQSWWFYTLLVIFVSCVVYLVIRIRTAQLQTQKIVLQQEVQKQTVELVEQNAEINDKKKKLEDQADVLQSKLLELYDQKEDLEALNTELNEQSSELVVKNKQLLDVIDTKNKLLSIIAHDIKNPFQIILNAAKQLVVAPEKNNTKEASDVIYKASNNINSLLSNLLDWAMSQSGLITYSPTNILCNSFLQKVIDEIKQFANQKNIHITLSCDNQIWLFADNQMLSIVIRNIIHNSLKFTPEGGMITLRCSLEGEQVKIEIIDTGVGMDAETIGKLFEVNNVISERGTRDEEGRGLGLLVVKDFILRNKGSIEVLSKKKNGSNFILRLPKGSEDATIVEANVIEITPAVSPQLKQNQNVTVLLVDDNEALRTQLTKSLSELYQVLSCANATEAIEVLKTNKVHIVVSDIIMGEIDGISFCNIIKKELRMSIPIILITGIDSSDTQVSAFNNGADDFIKKPFELDVLIARIQNLLLSQKQSKSTTFDISAHKIKPQDQVFAEKLRKEVEKGIPDPEFSVEILAQRMGTSRANLFKKTKKSIGISPSDYIHHARLEVASVLLQNNAYRIAEVAYMVGYSDPLYFSSCFSKHYGVSPSDYKARG